MLRRFVSGCVVPCLTIPIGTIGLYCLAHYYVRSLSNPYQVAMLWCWVPLVWGVWAMLTPKSWMPEKLPVWGTILGVIVSTLAVFVFNVPHRLLGWNSRIWLRISAVIIAAIGYYLLWMGVRALYNKLTNTEPAKTFNAAA